MEAQDSCHLAKFLDVKTKILFYLVMLAQQWKATVWSPWTLRVQLAMSEFVYALEDKHLSAAYTIAQAKRLCLLI
jgi:hypothetical protein